MLRDRTFIRRSSTLLLGSTMLLGSGAAFAQAAPPATDPAAQSQTAAQVDDSDTIVVTAQRRAENLQDVPIAITAITTKTLDELQIDAFDDYARLVPSLSYKSAGPGSSNVYFRGVASGENANHSASLPSVGTYLDEQPITTITGALDIHVFDIARVEALAGPQGTLYGASSQAGTVRIITNKPDQSGTYGEANIELNKVAHGDFGYTGEAFLNTPLTSRIALRTVGWYRHDAGYIDNVADTFVFPSLEAEQGTAAATFTNAPFAEDDYNDVDTYGARAALRIELDDNWTLTPSIVAQKQVSNGSFSVERGLGDLETAQFNPEKFTDKWYQAALAVEGKLGNFDVTYAGSYMQRQIDGQSDYSDYAYFYDKISGYGAYFYDNADALVNPNQYIISDDSFTKMAHELRFTSPAEKRVRIVGGLFYQRQTHNIQQDYIIDNIADAITVPGTDSNIWLTKQLRTDRDYAAFGEVSFDITPQLTATAGGRFYKYDNTLVGFFGYSAGYSSRTGVAACFGAAQVDGSPCTNVDKRTKDNGFIHRLNLTYKPNDDMLFYTTWSRGFRPGGINRRGNLPPYAPDFITNYEAGMKLSFMDNRVRFNAAAYRLDWDGIQLSFLGANGLTEIRNAGNARIHGAEFDLYVRPAVGFTINAGAAFNNAKLKNDFCTFANDSFNCAIPGPEGDDNALLAESDTRLPLTARFKGNVRTRYEWPIGPNRAHVQLTTSYEGARRRDLRDVENAIYGNMAGYAQTDASTGLTFGRWKTELFVKNLFDKRGEISKSVQCNERVCGDIGNDTARGGKVYTTVTRPRTLGIRLGRTF